MRRRLILVLLVLLALPSLAFQCPKQPVDPNLPVCGDPEPTGPYLIADQPFMEGYEANCGLRVFAYPEVSGGVRFELHRNGALVAEATATTYSHAVEIPEHQTQCDGTIEDDYQVRAYEYNHAFVGVAQIGDTVTVYANGAVIGTTKIVEFGCPTVDWAGSSCRVACGESDEEAGNGGCNTGGAHSSWLAVALAVLLLRRRACACRA